ncbi:hypothetical protein ACFQE1_06545 [Halobium palmae]|uniref:Cox cluster protein n=1 Tax=Halobium palmae TaxID=1776492 RepID=A0ABD5RYE2_9EURY
MDESRLWGGVGVLLAVLGFAVIAPELFEMLGHGLLEPTVLYGIGVAAVAVLTLLALVPSVIRG